MEDIDGVNGVEGYLYEPERADFPNIQNNFRYMTIHQVTVKDNVSAYSAMEEPKWSRARGVNVVIVYDRKPTMSASVVKNVN